MGEGGKKNGTSHLCGFSRTEKMQWKVKWVRIFLFNHLHQTLSPPEMLLGGLYLKPNIKESPLQLMRGRGEENFRELEIRPF